MCIWYFKWCTNIWNKLLWYNRPTYRILRWVNIRSTLVPIMKLFLMIMMANGIRGWMWSKFSWHLSYRWGIIIIIIMYVLPKGRSFTTSAGTTAAVLPKTGLPLQTQEPRLQFYLGWIGAVASCCFLHPILTSASLQTLKDLKRSQGHQRGGEESWFGYLGPPELTEIHHKG